MFGLSELALILIVVVVLLGAKKLPELARSAGKAARILKSETKALKKEKEGEDAGAGTRTDTETTASGGRVVTGTIVERNDPPVRP
ncbi:twin-arginine translocase TatA/TatE family subunit [Streptomyces sp. GMY02]|uniref:twin-arginine translocase TatA/TatE family subunit n=1 Tax=Streptomyces sp. GMY02 TaxID=1333528 RepID=UPI001C2CA325|nr:twin-arginine translocase TatA/TatE family subunit [Streptomyces sp. GMY02]QXE35540.1 twin-arginine translocase TatA/TatE family subunit [Streptomyces sp. GMY02]